MSDKITKSPLIRFAGFTDAWEQRTFSELVNRVSKSSEVDELPRVEYEDIVSGQGELNKDIFAKESDKKGIEFEFGDTLFGKLRPYLQNWLLADFKGIAVGDWWVLRPDEMDSKFIYSLIQSSKYQIVANLSTGSKMPRSDWNVVSQTEFSVPTDKGEQAKIGQLFNQLNHLLTLHQRELGLLKDTKKSLLQKMFPKDGANIPEIRFAGFADAWEPRKLGELAPLRGGFAFKSDEFQESGIPIVRISNILRSGEVGGDFTYYPEQEKDDNYLLPNRSAVLAMSGATTGKVSILCNPDGGKVYQNQRVGYFTKTDFADYGFVSTITRSQMFIKQLSALLVAGAQPNISSKDIDTMTFYVPTNLEEQTKIGILFEKLDDFFTLHQRQLNLLKDLKKSLLQQMFI
ncbi:restriction endonuclease subunit S [Bacillus pumilus]|uniref:restriction endonuclease subunit S n=1 Tax=Bacillus pumilus TaxID=1408 RepID=UPI0011E93816|nr:restriction endonuclease subunit S [Bacillus pumilus]TYS35360.1 restriction endonuclease subunit S [Bacillus pumilus]TYS52772.1 restriction endonuclease subunit S [Bacillus pumilus]